MFLFLRLRTLSCANKDSSSTGTDSVWSLIHYKSSTVRDLREFPTLGQTFAMHTEVCVS